MKSFEQILNEATDASSRGELADKRKFDPKNPDVRVKGVGVYKLRQLYNNVAAKFKDLAETATAAAKEENRHEDFQKILELVSEKSILSHLLGAISDVEKELNSPLIKRRITLMAKSKLPVIPEEVKKEKDLYEAAPPDKDIEKFILAAKPKFKAQYGKDWEDKLYATAWKMYSEKHGKK